MQAYTIDDSRRDHPNWWTPGAMRFFATRVSYATETPVTVDGSPGVVFITGETGPDGRRGYSIRLHSADTVLTIDGDGRRTMVRQYATRAQAVAAMVRWIKAGARIVRD